MVLVMVLYSSEMLPVLVPSMASVIVYRTLIPVAVLIAMMQGYNVMGIFYLLLLHQLDQE